MEVANVLLVTKRFKLSLSGDARLWIEGKVFTGIADIKDRFLARFSPAKSKLATLQEFNNVKYAKEKGVDRLVEELKRLSNKIGYTDVQVRDRFLESLPSDCRTAVVMASTEGDNVDALATIAQRFLDVNSGSSTVKFADNVMTSTDAHSQNNFDMSSLEDQVNRIVDRRDGVNNRGRFQRQSRGRYRSQSRGRRHRSPSLSPNRRTSYRNNIICDFCHRRGHVWRQCYQRQNENRFNSTSSFSNRGRGYPRSGQNF